MSYFVYCNKCLTLPSRSVKYFLTQCGHIFCHNCVAQVKSAKKCLSCNKSTAVIQISKEAGSNVTDFFTPVGALLKKIMEIDQFQMQRRTNFTEVLQKKNHDYRAQLAKAQEEIKRITAENQNLKAKLAQHHASPGGSSNSDNRSKRFQTSTPMSQITGITSSQIDDVSIISGPNQRSVGCSKSSTPSPGSIHPGYAKRAMIMHGRIGYPDPPGSASSKASSHQRVPTSSSFHQRRPLQPLTAGGNNHHQRQAGTNTSLEHLRRMVNSRYSNERH